MADSREVAMEVLRTLRASGHVALFAGGCVRDQLWGLTPKDYDVATSARPEEVRRLFRNTQAVGVAFGVILVRLGGAQVEVATFRSDGDYSDGRRPDSVEFATPEADAQRRDFTINGLFLDPLSNEVIDYVGGQEDLAARRLRAIGDPAARFTEDHLRLLRAVRFAARFDLALDATTAKAIRERSRFVRTIAPDRVGEETRKMLTAPTRAKAFELLQELGLLWELLRFVPLPTDDDARVETFAAVGPRERVSFALSLAAAAEAISSEIDPGAFERGLRQSLRLSNEESESVCELLGALREVSRGGLTLARKRRILARGTAGDLLVLMDGLATAGRLSSAAAGALPELHELSLGDNAPAPLVTGDDLIARGLSPGPKFKRLLEATYDAQLERRVTTPEEAMAHALGMALQAEAAHRQ
jgi:tRNA nucleotidyltransferase/poly(A) polymerase